MKKLICAVLFAAMLLSLCACGDPEIGPSAEPEVTAAPVDGDPIDPNAIIDAAPADIILNGSSASSDGNRVNVNGGEIKIVSGGEYNISGTLSSGCIIVNTGEDAKDVTLILNGVDITNPEGAVIYVQRAKNVRIVLSDGSVNRLVSGSGSKITAADTDAAGAAVYSKSDLYFEGEGSLEIISYINNGITCKDDLKIHGGTISVTAANNGIRGDESVKIKGGNITVSAENDGIKATCTTKEGKGYVEISGGSVSVSCKGDGISAVSELNISGGSISVSTSGNPLEISCKALKCGGSINVSGGDIQLFSNNSKGVKADGDITVSGGSLYVKSSDDGISSDTAVLVSGGEIEVLSAAGGIKAGVKGTTSGSISISGGSIFVTASESPILARGSLTLNGGTVVGTGGSSSVKNISENSSCAYVVFKPTGTIPYGSSVRVGGTSVEFTAQRSFSLLFVSGGEIQRSYEYTMVSDSGNTTAVSK